MTPKEKQMLRKLYADYAEIKKEEGSHAAAVFKKEIAEEYEFKPHLFEEMAYSLNQLQFIKDAREAEIEIYFDYSGRGMDGNYCPATKELFNTTAEFYTDQLGKGMVYYARF